jgi:glycosyltransferase involved in cell wall biosynthesis
MTIPPSSETVAIVHDYLNQPGGAERCVLEMARIWPGAPLYTSLYRPGSTFPEFEHLDVRTSPLNRLPVDKRFRALLPLYPAAFRSLGTLDHKLVISSSSGWAHAVRTAPETLHVVYCYAPARWLWSSSGYIGGKGARRALTPVTRGLRAWDRSAARAPDAYIAIAANVRDRIRAVYGRDADVVYPPVDTARFRPCPRGGRLLVLSRLLSYKRVDLAVEAATRRGMPLDVVGTGPALSRLQALAGPTVTFHGRLDDASVTALIHACSAVIFPGTEDFGIVAVEANAAGKPVVAFAAGGALETLTDGVTAVMFQEPTVDSLLGALDRLQGLDISPEVLAASAARFSTEAFEANLKAAVERARDRRDGRGVR